MLTVMSILLRRILVIGAISLGFDNGLSTAFAHHAGQKSEQAIAGDPRKVRTYGSPPWLAAIGKLLTTQGACSLSLIADSPEKDGVFGITAGHCVAHWNLRDANGGRVVGDNSNEVNFVTNGKVQIRRRIVQVIHDEQSPANYAIVRLNEPISKDHIRPLIYDRAISSEIASDSFAVRHSLRPEQRPFASFAAYHEDITHGQGGKFLTFQDDCHIEVAHPWKHTAFCFSYWGSLGGPIVLTVDYNALPFGEGVRHLFIGSANDRKLGDPHTVTNFTPHEYYATSLTAALSGQPLNGNPYVYDKEMGLAEKKLFASAPSAVSSGLLNFATRCDGRSMDWADDCARVGHIFRDGLEGFPRDYEFAKKMFERSCNGDNAGGCQALATLERDAAKAMQTQTKQTETANVASTAATGRITTPAPSAQTNRASASNGGIATSISSPKPAFSNDPKTCRTRPAAAFPENLRDYFKTDPSYTPVNQTSIIADMPLSAWVASNGTFVFIRADGTITYTTELIERHRKNKTEVNSRRGESKWTRDQNGLKWSVYAPHKSHGTNIQMGSSCTNVVFFGSEGGKHCFMQGDCYGPGEEKNGKLIEKKVFDFDSWSNDIPIEQTPAIKRK